MNRRVQNFLIDLKNNSLIDKPYFKRSCNGSILKIVSILYREGFLQSFKLENNILVVYFNKSCGINFLKDLKIISKISCRVYLQYRDICKIKDNGRLLLFSTSKNVLTIHDCKRKRIGGELLLKI
jgi:ribosomal protein S8